MIYLSGTIDPTIVATVEPWDDTSNLHGIAGADAGSVRAAMEALRIAGAQPGDPILPVGYSQGGIAATSIAVSGAYDTRGLVTFGSPTGQIPVPDGVRAVSVEHTDDLIPALGGLPLAAGKGGLDRLVVRQSSGASSSDPRPLAAHDITGYGATGAQMDSSSDPRLVEARGSLEEFTGDSEAEVTFYRADRAPQAIAPDRLRGISAARRGG